MSKLAANLAGVSVGGFIMVLAFLRDNRVDEERERATLQAERAEFQPDAVLDRIRRWRSSTASATAALMAMPTAQPRGR